VAAGVWKQRQAKEALEALDEENPIPSGWGSRERCGTIRQRPGAGKKGRDLWAGRGDCAAADELGDGLLPCLSAFPRFVMAGIDRGAAVASPSLPPAARGRRGSPPSHGEGVGVVASDHDELFRTV
jgi:hypothetical protein